MTQTNNTSDGPAKAPVRQRVRPQPPAPPAGPGPQIAQVDTVPPAPAEAGDKVGYKNPPRHSQFKPGFDPRRPRGRKPGAKGKANCIIEMMESPTTVRTPEGDVRSISTAAAMARKLRELALSGQLAAIVKALDLYLKTLPPVPVRTDAEKQALAEMPADLSVTDLAILEALRVDFLADEKALHDAKGKDSQ